MSKPNKFHHRFLRLIVLILYFILKHLVLVSSADSCSTYRKCLDLGCWTRILRKGFLQRPQKSCFFLQSSLQWLIYDFLCQHLRNICFLCGIVFIIYSVFFCHCDTIPSIILFVLLFSELLCHGSDKLQFPQ